MGDLNYRLEMERDEIYEKITREDWSGLLKRDQLNVERNVSISLKKKLHSHFSAGIASTNSEKEHPSLNRLTGTTGEHVNGAWRKCENPHGVIEFCGSRCTRKMSGSCSTELLTDS